MSAGAGQRQAPCGAAEAAGTMRPAVVVQGLGEIRAALALAGPRGLLLVSMPGAAGSLGAAGFLALLAAAATDRPEVPRCGLLDCADAPGQALAALRAGVRHLVLDPACPGFAAVAGAAAECGAILWPARPAALDLGRLDLRRPAARARLAAWLNPQGSPQGSPIRPHAGA